MTVALKIRKIGNSLGVLLPEETLQAMKVGEGDSVYLVEAPDSSPRATGERPGFEDIMKMADEGMDQYRNALRELAK